MPPHARLDTRLGPILLALNPRDGRGSPGEIPATVWAQTARRQCVQETIALAPGRLRGMQFSIGEARPTSALRARRILDVVVTCGGRRRPSATVRPRVDAQPFITSSGRLRETLLRLSEIADVTYKCSTYYHADVERAFATRRAVGTRGRRLAKLVSHPTSSADAAEIETRSVLTVTSGRAWRRGYLARPAVSYRRGRLQDHAKNTSSTPACWRARSRAPPEGRFPSDHRRLRGTSSRRRAVHVVARTSSTSTASSRWRFSTT